MKAIFTDPGRYPYLALREAALPVQVPDNALIRVTAFSLNQGETRTALAAADSYVPGWDFAGVVEKTAAHGNTPEVGTRVFGFVAQGTWAEYVAVPGALMAKVPAGVTDSQAACLPVAGITAHMCLGAAGEVSGRRILITGAAGGVGRFLCQLVADAGGRVFVLSRRTQLEEQLKADGVKPESVFTTMTEAKAAGMYDIIFDSIGGETLGAALITLSPDGLCVNFGNSSRQPTTFQVRGSEWPFQRKRCIWLGREVPDNCTAVLTHLASLVLQGRLRVPIDTELPWTRTAEAAERLIQHRVDGKIVLHVGRIEK